MDCGLTADFREAAKIRQENSNNEAWLYGAYVYTALCDAAPIFNSNARRGTKPRPYPDKPFELTNGAPKNKTMSRRERKEAKEREAYEVNKQRFANMAAAINRKFEKAGDE